MNSLLFTRRFGPLFATSILGALNDNFLRAAILVYAVLTVSAGTAATVGLAAGGLLALPFVLFSSLAGTLADRFDKTRIARIAKIFEVGVAALAIGAFATNSLPLMLSVIFLMGTQSALFGPLKFGWLPERLKDGELVKANAWIESGTYVAILGGTILGGLSVSAFGLMGCGIIALVVALVGLATSLLMPRGQAAAPDLPLCRNPFAGNVAMLKGLAADRTTLKSVILICWFWSAGAIYLSSLPAHLADLLGNKDIVVTATMTLFAIGIGIGSLAAERLLKGRVGLWLAAPSAALLGLSGATLWFGLTMLSRDPSGITSLLSPAGFLMGGSLLLAAVAGGLFSVPLAATIQERAPKAARARRVAATNVATSLSIASVSGIVSGLVALGLPLPGVFLTVAVVSLGFAILSAFFFPRESLQGLARLILKPWFRVEIEGAEHLRTEGGVVFAPNHVSLVDGPLLFSLIERECSFVMDTGWASKPGIRKLKDLVPIAPINPGEPMSAKAMARRVRDGEACVIFPEGRITTHGALMKVFPGAAWIIDMADAPVVPIHIAGLELCRWSREKQGFRLRLRPTVRLKIGAPRRLEIDPELKGKARRVAATRALGEIMEDHTYASIDRHASLPAALAHTAERFGKKRTVIEDPLGNSLSIGKIQLGAAALGAALERRTTRGETIGVFIPGVATAPVVLFGLWRAGAIPAMLNPTLGRGPAVSALETAGIRRVLASRAFVEQADLSATIEAFEEAGTEILWIEDIKAAIGAADKLRAMLAAGRLPEIGRDDPAVVLFTSGTEGAPKGVVLSHGNLLANIAQLRTRTDVGPHDRVLSALPLFHSFGLTGGTLLPLLAGAHVMIYPSPLHYRVIPHLAYTHQSTIMFGTDTFLAGWGRKADAYDFATVRAAIAGAEPVKTSTREMWMEKFGVRILEGYGATETAPVLALNTPQAGKSGTVGRLLPGIESKLETVPGLEGGKLHVKGPNIMAGYYRPERPAELQPPSEGWYDTGDVVAFDADGFLRITGRVKRFAKVGGEMVSLAAVESLANRAWPDVAAGALIEPCPKKGERVTLAVAGDEVDRAGLAAVARAAGIAEILLPSRIVNIDTMPLLASGKVDYPALARKIAPEAA